MNIDVSLIYNPYTAMKKHYYIALVCLFFLLFGCHSENEQSENKINTELLNKIEQLRLLSTDSTIQYFDLSNDSLDSLPDLSQYQIVELNLSYNQLDTLHISHFPQSLKVLNVSNNLLKGTLYISENEIPSLKEINLSDNKLDSISISQSLRKIDVSHNNLTYLTFSNSNIEFLDISYNHNMSNKVYFHPEKIDTIIYDSIGSKRKLQFFLEGAIIH